MARLNTLITVGKGSPFTMYDLWNKRPLINYSTSMSMPASVSYDIPLKQPIDQDFAGLREYADANAARYFKKYNQPESLWGDLPYYAASAGILTLDSLANRGASNAVGNTFNTLSDIGMMLPGPYKAIGLGLKGAGFIANGFTNSVNKEYQNLKNNQILNYANTSSNASDYPQLQMDMDDAMTNTVDLGKIGDWGSKGFLSSGSKRRNAFNNAQAALGTATNMRIADINQRGIGINQRNTLGQLGRLSAFGGYIGGALDIMQDDKHIDAINNRSLALARRVNRFPGGGQMASFLDHFKVDPIKAAVDYINSRKAMTNIFEEAEASGRREKEFQDVQKRLAAAETQNQGLQALLDSQGLSIQNLMNQQLQNNYADNWEQRMNPSAAPNDTAVMARMRKSLIDRGVDNRAHQDAIIANMMVESSGNPNAKNPKSSARGLMQWLTGRQPKAWDWDSQVDHIVNTYNKFGGDNWLDKEAYNKFMNTTDSTEAARLFRRYWERPEAATYNFTDKYINQMYSKKAFGGEKETTLPEVVVTPNNIVLDTYRPLIDDDYKLTGHSVIHNPTPYINEQKKVIKAGYQTPAVYITNNGQDKRYNILSNNCSDATRRALEAISGKKMNPFLFTTPGDVKDFAEQELDGVTRYRNGHYETVIPISQNQRKLLHEGNWREESKHAFGGELGTNGTDFTNGIIEINAGDTHENNPMQGVPMGIDENGVPNLVEEGETVFNDYVFSKRMMVPDFMHKELGLGGVIKDGISFADASKKIAEESTERPNDPISIDGLKAGLSKLAQVQEAERMRIQAEEDNAAMEMGLMAACGGKINRFDLGGDIRNWLKTQNIDSRYFEDFAKAIEKGVKTSMYTRKNVNGKIVKTPIYSPQNFKAALDNILKGENNLMSKSSVEYWRGKDITDRNRNHFNYLTKELGMNKELAFELSMPSYKQSDFFVSGNRPSENYTDMNAYNKAKAARDAEYQRLVKGVNNPKKANNNTSDTISVPKGTPLFRNSKSGNVYRTKEEAQADNGIRVTNNVRAAKSNSSDNNETANTPTTVNVTATGAGTTARNYSTANNRGDIVNYKYDWYRNGTDGITDTPWGFTPNENGLIDRNTGYTNEYRNLVKTLTADDIRKWAAEHPNDTSLQSFIARGNNLDNLTTDQWRRGATDGKYGFMHHVASLIGQEQSTPTISGNVYHAVEGEGDYLPADQSSWRGVGNEVRREVLPNGDTVIYHAPGYSTQTQDNGYTFTDELLGINNGGNTSGADEDIPLYPTWMRYAPAVGAGIMTLTDALGLTNKPDYTYANRIEAAADRLGYAPNIGYNPVDGYVAYNPFDRNYVANRMLDNSAGLRRSILNSNASNGARNAMMLALNAQDQQGLGQMYRQADESNINQRLQTGDFNRRTKMVNSQLGLEAAMANARFRLQAQSAKLSGLAQAAAMREAIDQRVGASRSANITNLLTSLGNIGRENMAFNMINTDAANDYAILRNGRTGHKSTLFNKKKNGGRV